MLIDGIADPLSSELGCDVGDSTGATLVEASDGWLVGRMVAIDGAEDGCMVGLEVKDEMFLLTASR